MKKELKVFEIEAVTNPPMLDVVLYGAKPELVKMKVKGYSLEDAKKRAGVQ